MKKDYVYQDKGQFKLLQNAEKIGGFLVSDQDVVPDESILPEQKFAHQPMFRRPPEELVATTHYLQYREFVIATEDTGKKFNGDPLSPVLKVQGLVSYQEPTPEAKALADKFVQGDVWDSPGWFTKPELQTLARYYVNDWVTWTADLNPATADPRLFKRRLFYLLVPEGIAEFPTWSSEFAGKFALRNAYEVLPWQGDYLDKIHFLYQDGTTFGLVVANDSLYYVYMANSLNGPWVQTSTIDPNTPSGQQSLVILLQKDCGRLLRLFGVLGPNPAFPVFIPGITVGKTGEWVGLWGVSSSSSKHVCRMTKKSGGIELEQAHIKLKFKNGQIKSFPGISSDW